MNTDTNPQRRARPHRRRHGLKQQARRGLLCAKNNVLALSGQRTAGQTSTQTALT